VRSSAHILTAREDHISFGVRLSTVVVEGGTFWRGSSHLLVTLLMNGRH
jgi:hypothetical protein